WHKPHITRQEAINMLRNKPPGSFVVRNSHSFAGGYGLALKVSQLPPNVQAKGGNVSSNLVRHFLIESTPRGVKLKGCSNEPVFASLSALIYQHSITPLSLPCKLLLPEPGDPFSIFYQRFLIDVLYLDSFNTESLTGAEALQKSVSNILSDNWKNQTGTKIDLRISGQGVVLTDHKHRIFFRRHYPLEFISYCGLEPSAKIWTFSDHDGNTLFGIVARKLGTLSCNGCHVFMEVDVSQFPASYVVQSLNQLLGG
ncbi:hypothetical protein HELRODRAFT_133482, partial [Helobdella robusta]|uniref:SH2 domain-containing protein n=1 Tax=Helobdella robusta TaxID=6412 RepID=T1EI12_HELRO